MDIHFSLISHTNVGKTTLARTLIREDIGKVLDREHVTQHCASYRMQSTPQHQLYLWDTPGFGRISFRTVQEIGLQVNPIVAFENRVFSADAQPHLQASWLALQNVRDVADIVLYLIDAKQEPEWIEYLQTEMEMLRWTETPTLILLNQTTQSAKIEQTEEKRHGG